MLAIALKNELQFIEDSGIKLDNVELYFDTDTLSDIWENPVIKVTKVVLHGNKLIFSK